MVETLSNKEILKRLPCIDIPDTRELQRIRLRSIETLIPDERYIKEHYSEELKSKLQKTPRIFLLPKEEQRRVYSLSIPLSFPDYQTARAHTPDIKTNFNRFGSSTQAMHLTTTKGLNEILSILTRHKIPISSDLANGKIFDSGKIRPAITAPHSWQADTSGWGDGEDLFKHQFIVCNQDVLASPYYVFKEFNLVDDSEKTEDNSNSNYAPEYEHFKSYSRAVLKKFYSKATFFSRLHFPQPKDYLPEKLNEEIRKEIGTKLRHGIEWIIESAKIEVLKIEESILIYDPKWIGQNPLNTSQNPTKP